MIEFGAILRPSPTSIERWAECWSQCYSETYAEDAYETAFDELEQASSDATLRGALLKLFQWKNGGPLSQRKRKAVESIRFSDWTRWNDDNAIPRHFASGAVWNIFLAHLVTGGRRPIFDQHSWRACSYLTSFRCEELLKMRPRRRYAAYAQYEEWFYSISSGVEARTLDRALMAYGQFLSSQFRVLLDSPEYVELTESTSDSRGPK